MPSTYEPIATTTGSNSSPEVTFTSIPNTYTDLKLVINTTPSNSATVMGIYVNATTGNTCSTTTLYGNGSSAISTRATSAITVNPAGSLSISSSDRSTFLIDFMNYSNTSTFKTVLSRASSASGWAAASVGLIQTTSAISTISISTLNGSYFWNTGSTFTLYGIKAA
jgi:hypothetical protein